MAEIWELVDIKKNKTGIIHERGKEDSIPQGMCGRDIASLRRR